MQCWPGNVSFFSAGTTTFAHRRVSYLDTYLSSSYPRKSWLLYKLRCGKCTTSFRKVFSCFMMVLDRAIASVQRAEKWRTRFKKKKVIAISDRCTRPNRLVSVCGREYVCVCVFGVCKEHVRPGVIGTMSESVAFYCGSIKLDWCHCCGGVCLLWSGYGGVESTRRPPLFLLPFSWCSWDEGTQKRDGGANASSPSTQTTWMSHITITSTKVHSVWRTTEEQLVFGVLFFHTFDFGTHAHTLDTLSLPKRRPLFHFSSSLTRFTSHTHTRTLSLSFSHTHTTAPQTHTLFTPLTPSHKHAHTPRCCVLAFSFAVKLFLLIAISLPSSSPLHTSSFLHSIHRPTNSPQPQSHNCPP